VDKNSLRTQSRKERELFLGGLADLRAQNSYAMTQKQERFFGRCLVGMM